MKRRSMVFRKIQDRAMRFFSAGAVLFAVGAMCWILGVVAARGAGAVDWTFLTRCSRPFGAAAGGVANALVGTLLITGGAVLIAVPPAVFAGIGLAEFRECRRCAAVTRFCANVLMGIPSVLVGLFVYTILVVPTGRFSGFAGSVALAIIMFPVVMRTTEEMLAMVPDSLRESALALGMSRARASLAIVCRSAKNGLLTGILLALSRVAGETAPLLFTAMCADSWPTGYFSEPTANLPVLVTEYATDSPFEAMHRAGWGAALLVTLLVLAVNVTTRILFREKKHGN